MHRNTRVMSQNTRSHPVFSRLGCSSALLVAVLLTVIVVFRGGGPFSPGDVTATQPRGEPLGGFNNHAEFEEDCVLCHAPWLGTTAERCESCHVTVATERITKMGLHGRMLDVERCESCHTEHKGRDADITYLDETRFNHTQLVGFSLAQHTNNYDGSVMACMDCHKQGSYRAEFVDCVACHTEAEPAFMAEHTAQFGASCLNCHDGHGRLVNFDHDTVFVLAGAHVTATCESCHVNQIFEGTPRECVACHEEPEIHAGQFGLDCERCHTEVAWSPAGLTQHTFPLDHGGEGKIACETCHTTTYTAYTCYNCHEHDPAETREIHHDEGIFEFENCVECHPTGQEADDD